MPLLNRKPEKETIRKMNNYIDYLIILFFVISALASLLKKKPRQESPTTKESSQPKPSVSQQQDQRIDLGSNFDLPVDKVPKNDAFYKAAEDNPLADKLSTEREFMQKRNKLESAESTHSVFQNPANDKYFETSENSIEADKSEIEKEFAQKERKLELAEISHSSLPMDRMNIEKTVEKYKNSEVSLKFQTRNAYTYNKIFVPQRASGIKIKLKNRKRFKESFVISEVLQKPLALRENA